MSKDLFSRNSPDYLQYRPSYPPELFEYILQFVSARDLAWDCATGNGQAAAELSLHFKQVEATDISESQIRNAIQRDNIHYSVCPGEKTGFKENSFNLVTVAQAYHWLNWNEFHQEVQRVAKPGCIVAIWVYNLLQSREEKLNDLLHEFCYGIVGSYWDEERKYVDDGYATVEFDFTLLPSAEFEFNVWWTRDQLTGYLDTWSAVQHYKNKNKTSPLPQIANALNLMWNDEETIPFRFPIYLKLGRIEK